MVQCANYNGDATHIVGERFSCPHLKVGQLSAPLVRWVATDAVYDESTNMTRVEFDGEEV